MGGRSVAAHSFDCPFCSHVVLVRLQRTKSGLVPRDGLPCWQIAGLGETLGEVKVSSRGDIDRRCQC